MKQTRRAPTPSYDRRRPRGFVARRAEGGGDRFAVTDPTGATVPGVLLSSAGSVIEFVRR
jgi:hypothetical protein